jgi:nucleoside-triphosphatase THEP1
VSRISFIITGPKRVGKSFLCWQILKYLRELPVSAGGVITLQNKKKWFYLVLEKQKISFEIDTDDEEFIPIGSYKVHKKNLDRVILAIQTGITCDYLFVDEIGGLELQKKGYYPVLNDVFNREMNNIIVVNQKKISEFFKQYPKAQTYEVINIEHCWIYPYYNVIKNQIDLLLN